MADTLVLPAPAKLNLFLHITGQRADGYHLLQTLFIFLDYADLLWLWYGALAMLLDRFYHTF